MATSRESAGTYGSFLVVRADRANNATDDHVYFVGGHSAWIYVYDTSDFERWNDTNRFHRIDMAGVREARTLSDLANLPHKAWLDGVKAMANLAGVYP